ncbi:helix-turn-helix domain-containing protein [Amycolatopsis methanolica]|uniref:MarR family transcriptional regulator n=1 Tax=Amycolatopsis methanolica 239 TaxID=1068978 RepID=A0A076MZL0_AMYME|nr:hypothetical protein [Amycolatopsis methanolica]AIJ26789.1 hypothetical protein AMETH_6697 [Amycolatopsis methanolica 239]
MPVEIAREIRPAVQKYGGAFMTSPELAEVEASGLALFAGRQQVSWPADPVARIGHGLMLLREYRGGLHFAVLRAVGLTVPEAVVTDPEGGRARLLRTACSPETTDELIARARRRPDLEARWRRAESLTDEQMGELLEVLSAAHRDALVRSLADLGREE